MTDHARSGSDVARTSRPDVVRVSDLGAETCWRLAAGEPVERVPARARRRLARHGPHPWAPGDRDDWIRIVPSSVTGRAISRRRHQVDGHFLPYMPPG